jgi:hypothetical protein
VLHGLPHLGAVGGSVAPRKLVPVPEELLDRLRRVAERTGVPVQKLVERILGEAARAISLRPDAVTSIAEAVVVSEIQRYQVVLLPFDVLIDVINSMDDNSFSVFVKRYRDFVYAVARSIAARGADGVQTLYSLLSVMLPNLLVTVAGDGLRGRVVVASPRLVDSSRARRLVSTVVASILESLGFKPVSIGEDRGVVTIEYTR